MIQWTQIQTQHRIQKWQKYDIGRIFSQIKLIEFDFKKIPK